MGSLFRSEEMALCQVFIQPEAAYPSVAMLGERGIVQFRDLNSSVNVTQRKFVNELRRCCELERMLRYVESEVAKDGIVIRESDETPTAPNPREMIDLEASLEKTGSEILELSENYTRLKVNFVELKEMQQVLIKAQDFLVAEEMDPSKQALLGGDDGSSRLSFVAGVIPRERVYAFERMLWRFSRGNVYVREAPVDEQLEDPTTGRSMNKAAFVVFFQGENLKSGVRKVCNGFRASIYPCPTSGPERAEMVKGIRVRLEDLKMVLHQTSDHRQRALGSVARQLHTWGVMVRKMKAIYHTLNMFNMDVTKKCLIGECWVPLNDLPAVKEALADGGKMVGSSIPSFVNVIETSETRPTFFRTNKFTAGFQTLVDAYGVSSYREVNPGLYTIVTFPFLFAVMFGDLGHGLIVTLFSLYMVLNEKKYTNEKGGEIWRIMFGGRYIILLMGIFSMYTGVCYNDLFSISLNIFGSSWKPNYNMSTIMHNRDLTLDPATDAYKQIPYPWGLDPVWQAATNKIVYLNSFKMKLSIILGVTHMLFGLSLSVVNHVHNRKAIYILFDFVPQVTFLVLLFGYITGLMFAKWILYFPTLNDGVVSYPGRTEAMLAPDDQTKLVLYPAEVKQSPACAPNILLTFINMVLLVESKPEGDCDPWMYSGQYVTQKGLLFTSLLCIPFMLLAKPIYIACKRRKIKHVDRPLLAAEDGLTENGRCKPDKQSPHNSDDNHHVNLEDQPMNDIIVHQAIHTIECVLSAVSHTASYLRLWALSLAHAQLSEVLWNRILRAGLTASPESFIGVIPLYISFAIWAFFTISILVLMEGLSAFLHTLRLHWVEFMSKFYEGLGYAFTPFNFKEILEPATEEDE